MKKQYAFQALTCSVNMFLIASVLMILFGLAWEYSTRMYLSGFANAVLPATSSPENKMLAILSWMQQGPSRSTGYYSDDGEDRDPVDTLNYRELLTVCGTATNAFVNLASASGIEARRLLLLDAHTQTTNHVVAEVFLDGNWIVVDPSYRVILKDSSGRFLTKQQLARPEILRDATQRIPNYNPAYTYDHTAFIHVAGLPLFGGFLQRNLAAILPVWQDNINWTVLVERQSYDTIVVGFALLLCGLVIRSLISWYGRRISMTPISPWAQLRRTGVALFSPFDSSATDNTFYGM